MKRRLLEFLCCPMCRAGLTLTELRTEAEIEEGMLACDGCGRDYPVINGIPRMLPDALAARIIRYHRPFFERYAGETARFRTRIVPERGDAWWAAEARTLDSYSYQWRKFKQMFPHWEQVFLESIKPISREFFKGRVGLDGGCGFGRSIHYAASYGAEMIGLDLSEAIEAARENTTAFEHVHLVQGDIFHPPVRPESLDFVYSIGVLHHLPDPKAGFLSLTRLLKPGAPMFIWVYLRRRGRQIAAFTLIRAVSTRLPLRLLNVICLFLAAGQWLLFLAPYRLLKRFRATAAVADRIPFTLYARYPFRTLHTDWFDGLSVPLQNYYRRDEIAAWYREGGLEEVQIDSDWNGRAFGRAPSLRDARSPERRRSGADGVTATQQSHRPSPGELMDIQTLGVAYSVVVPVHNEAPHLEAQLSRMVSALRSIGAPFELLVCENGSTDGSGEIAERLAVRWPEVAVERLNRADYGRALKHGIAASRHDCVVIYNLDFWSGEFAAAALRRLQDCDVLVGSKVMDGASDRRPLVRRAITRSFNAFLRVAFGFCGTDTHGMKAFRREPMVAVSSACETDGSIFDTELVLRAERLGLRVAEIPVDVREIRQPGYWAIVRRAPEVVAGLLRLRSALSRAPRAPSPSAVAASYTSDANR